MARIPEQEVERLKREVSLVRLIESQGQVLVRQGKDLACCCPWHAGDATPSCIVTEKSNLWHCFGCDAGGSVVDWVMRSHKVSFRHACELLLKEPPALAASAALNVTASRPGGWSSARPAADLAASADDPALLDQVIGFYHDTLKQSPEALAYLEKRGLGSLELAERFRLGFANRTLGYRLPRTETKAGGEVRGQLQRIGLLRESGHEHFNGSLVIPIFTEGHVTEVYGRKIIDHLRKGTPKHTYLPGPHRGVFNREGIERCEEVILCEALIDALTFWHAGYRNVTSSYGVNGFSDEILAALKQCGAKRVLIAYDRDEAGDRAAEALANQLQKEGFDGFRLLFPKGMDANSYALSVRPAAKSLGVVIRSAVWMGHGKPPPLAAVIPLANLEGEKDTKDTASLLAAALVAPPLTLPTQEPSPLPIRAVGEAPEPDIEARHSEHEVTLMFGERRYRVRGLAKNSSYEVMKINLLASSPTGLHVDTFDLYAAKARQQYAKAAAAELQVEESVVQRDLGKLLLKLEALQDALIQSALKPKVASAVAIAQADEAAALAFLRAPDLIERIVADFDKTGLVGEPVNALAGYLAAISRKLATPLAIIVQSTSAAGKSALMEAVLKLVPEEDRVQYSAMTGQSLFYLGEKDLKHKILAIAEEEGVRQAAYALKLLQSQGELTIASTGKDPATGMLVTQEYRVEGPVMLFLTTTAIDIDEELLNRCLVLTIDESREQTRLIQERQRQARTLAGLLQSSQAQTLTTLHRNAQRLLRPFAVVNPYAEQLSFLDERTRTRRDHQKYLTLIDSIALLHQHQRPIKSVVHDGKTLEYVEVKREDIALANRLAHEVLGRSLDELPPQTRRLLQQIHAFVVSRAQAQAIEPGAVRFTRREIREHTSFGQTQLTLHVQRLEQLEYLILHRGGRGNTMVYELVYGGEGENGSRFMLKLIAPGYDAGLSGESANLSAPNRPHIGVVSASNRPAPKPSDAKADAACSDAHPLNGQNARFPEDSRAGRRSSSLLAAALS